MKRLGISIALCALMHTGFSQPSIAQTAPPVKPLPIPTGVVPLPSGSPSNIQFTPLPQAAIPLPNAAHPLKASPELDAFNTLIHGKPISINQAVAISLGASREMAAAVAALLQSEGRTEEARAALNFTAGVNAQVTQFDKETTASLGPTSITLLNAFNPTIVAQATLPIDLFGQIRNSISLSQFQQDSARIEVNIVRNRTVYNVRTAFYGVLRAQAQLGVAADTLHTTLLRLDTVQKSYAAGVSARFDVIQSQTDVANAQNTFLQAQRQLSLSFIALKSAMGISISSPIKITDAGAIQMPDLSARPAPTVSDQLKPQEQAEAQLQQLLPDAAADMKNGIAEDVSDPALFGPDYQKLLDTALKERPEILQADAQIAAAKKGIRLAASSLLPNFALSVGYNLQPNAAGFTRYNQADISLGVSIPLWDGGLSRARRKEAEGLLASAVTERRTALDFVSSEVRQAYINLERARDSVAVAKAALIQATESYRLAQVRYLAGVSQQPGVSPILELSSAQTSLTEAATNRVTALYDYNSALVGLDEAVGGDSYTGEAPGYPTRPANKQIPEPDR